MFDIEHVSIYNTIVYVVAAIVNAFNGSIMKKTFLKTAVRGVRANTAKLLSLALIILLGIAFVTGLGTLSPMIERSFSDYLTAAGAPDIIAKCTEESGFSDEEADALASADGVEDVMPLTMIDMTADGINTRLYVTSGEWTIGAPVTEGEYPDAAGEAAAERASDEAAEIAQGSSVTLSFGVFSLKLEITGIASNPMIFDREGEPMQTDDGSEETLERILYVDSSSLPFALPVTDIYVDLAVTETDLFSDDYIEEVEERSDGIADILGEDCVLLTLEENKSYALLSAYCEKVTAITLIFPAFFIAVAALVVLTTMTRMIEEDRANIACCSTLGISGGRVIAKYVLISAVCCVVSSAAGMIAGFLILPNIIYPAFGTLFFMPPMSSYLSPWEGLISFAAMFAAVTLITAYAAKKATSESPASQLLPKAPKAGKKIFLEHIPVIWNRMSFRYKSCFRNIFRYVGHLLMTVISVMGSTALVFAGFSLMNVADSLVGGSFAGMRDSLLPISLVVIVFALLLCVFVIYNLTDMNIGERKSELATLKVLGYKESEVAAYIYREIFIMAVMGIVLGVLLGCGLIQFVLTYLEFGSLADVLWWSYILSAALVLVFVGAVDLLLLPKIRSIVMTESLKSVE